MGSIENPRLDSLSRGTSMGSEKIEHLGKSWSTERCEGSDTQDSDHEAPSTRLSRLSSPSVGHPEFYQPSGDDQSPETTAAYISIFGADVSQSNLFPASLITTSPSRNKYEPDSVTGLKQSGHAQVTMNTLSSASPESISATEGVPLSSNLSSSGSGVDFLTEPLRLSSRDFPNASLEFSPICPIDRSSRSHDGESRPNTAYLTLWPHVADGVEKDCNRRKRSDSIPVDSAKGNAREERLFDLGGLGGNVPDGNCEKLPLPLGPMVVQPTIFTISHKSSPPRQKEGAGNETSDSFAQWSRISVDENCGPEPDVLVPVETTPEARGLNVGGGLYQGAIPNLMGEGSSRISHEGSSREPTPALFSQTPQAKALNDGGLGPHQYRNNEVEQPKGLPGNMRMSEDSTAQETQPQKTKQKSRQNEITRLEGEFELPSKLEQEPRQVRSEQGALVSQVEQEYTEAPQTVQDLRVHIEALKEAVRKTIVEAEAEAGKHFSMLHKLDSDHRREILEHRKQAPIILKEKFEYYEERDRKHQQEVEEKNRIVASLRQSLENTTESHRTESKNLEAQYTNLVEQQNALVEHLRAELDEMVNLMRTHHGSSGMIDMKEAEEGVGERSPGISQCYDGHGLCQIITKLEGGGERQEFHAVVGEAEMSPKCVPKQSNLDEPLDETTLEAFGIRQLRTHEELLKRLLIESKGWVKELIRVNDDMGREKGELRVKNHDLEDRFNTLQGEKSSLQRLVNDTKSLNELLETQHSEAERRAQGELEKSAVTIKYFERALLNTRIAISKLEIERNSLTKDLEKAGQKSKVSRIRGRPTLGKENRLWRSKLSELKATGKGKANDDLVELEKSAVAIKYFERALLNTKFTISELQRENESLRKQLDRAAKDDREGRGTER
ncbi:hypothetical protein B9Z19DRAFT_1064222 [Tuber borchii]|uniref:Uncharacterized protein n=1 Tax=Tuber borchii TaxID=42251 RepID=A0A2T6ZVG4_TUBBO|nr:hypothetical protein B9Z19DRAFT_1064222 [Tuber borchii]